MAQGAIAFFLDAIVTSRVSRYKYGIEANVPYNPYDPQHAERSSQAAFMVDGAKWLPNAFSMILDVVCSQTCLLVPRLLLNVRESAFPKRRSFGRDFLASRHHDKLSTELTSLSKLTEGTPGIRGGSTVNLVTEFIVEHASIFSRSIYIGSFFDLCVVTADTSKLPKPKIKNPRGSHHEVSFEVVLLFGLTELKAQLAWIEGGVEKS